MIEFAKRLLWDASAFERYARGALLACSAALITARSGGEVDWYAAAAAFVAGLIGAGEKNRP